MRRICFVYLFLCLIATFSLSQLNPVPLFNPSARVASSIGASQADPKAQARILDSCGKLPLGFEANYGQADGRVKFLSRTSGYTLFLTGDEAVLAMRAGKAKNKFPVETRLAASPAEAKSGPIPESATGAVLRMKFHNANPAAKITGTDEFAGTSNYFIGNDPTKWRTSVPTYAKVKYEGIYSGIDLVYCGNQRQLEYDFIVAPGADPRRIAFDVSGAKRIRRDAHGDLVLQMKTGEDEIRWHKPVVYQEKDGARQLVAVRYGITDKNRVGFEVAKYDASRPLYIDPLIYSTYLGGSDADVGLGIAVDSAGNAYVTGRTSSTNFPTMNPLQPANGGIGYYDAFVAKINPAGSALVYSTYLGGSASDVGACIAVDSAGNVYVAGYTSSTNFPTKNPLQLQPAYGGGDVDAFVSKLNPTGSALVYSTYLGGSGHDWGSGIAADSAGNAYVTGITCSTDFPTKNPLQANYGGGSGQVCGDAFVTEINPTGSAFVYSTYLGGSGLDWGEGIVADSSGDAYVTGYTYSTDFPTMNALQPTFDGGTDAFVAKINPGGSALVYSTYLGGSGYDEGYAVGVDSAGGAYVTGDTNSIDFPVVNPLKSTYAGGGGDAFVAKLNPSGSAVVYSTYLGGSGYDHGSGIAVDSAGKAYVTGYTNSTDFPTMNPLQAAKHGGLDAFVAKLNPTGSALLYSTYLGGGSNDYGTGIAVDSAGNAFVTGSTSSSHFPTKNPLQAVNAGVYDVFVSKIDMRGVTTTILSSSPNPSTHGQAVTFSAAVASSMTAPPDGETVTFMKGTRVLGTGTLSGGSASFTTSALPVGTNYIKAVYGGDSNFAASTSKAVKQVVN